MLRQACTVALTAAVILASLALTIADEPKHAGGKAKNPPKELTVDLGGGAKLEMVLIPAGEFKMGSPDAGKDTAGKNAWPAFDVGNGSPDRDKDAAGKEDRRNPVWITKPFYLGKYLVTQEQWQALMGSNPSHFKGAKNPVETVSWDDCQQFLKRLNKRFRHPHPSPLPTTLRTVPGEGEYRLPSEAQWEYAWRAGGTTDPTIVNKPNAWGLFDLKRGMLEWCQDSYENGDDNYIRPGFRPGQGGLWRVQRSGTTWSRAAGVPTEHTECNGFRISQVPAEAVAETCTPGKVPPPAVAPFTAAAARQHQEAWAKHLGQPREAANSLGMKLVLIPPGEFQMGPGESAEDTAAPFNKIYGEHYHAAWLFMHQHPQHRVRITQPFYLGLATSRGANFASSSIAAATRPACKEDRTWSSRGPTAGTPTRKTSSSARNTPGGTRASSRATSTPW